MSHLYKRGSIWYVKYYRGGKPHYRSLRTPNRDVARQIQHAIDSQLDAGLPAIREQPQDIQVDSFWTAYEEWAKDQKSPNTLYTERIFWRQLVAGTGIRMLGDLFPHDVERWKRERRKKVSAQTVNDALRTLKALYNHARKLGLYEGENPFVAVTHYKIPKAPPRFLSREEIARLLEAARTYSPDALIYCALGLYAGFRRSEIAEARWEWFDFDRRLVTLQGNERFTLKDKDARTLPLSKVLAEILEPYRQKSGYILRPKRKDSNWRYRVDHRKSFNAVVKAADLSNVTTHTLRHTFGSTLASAGVSIYKIAKWMGHADVSTTQVYAHLQDFDEEIDRLS